MRLIDADALPSRALEEKRFVFTMHDRIKNEYIVETVYKDFADFINEAPTIDAEPVRHGRWTFPWTSPECSLCRKTQKWTSKYCPNCGAKMGGAEDEHKGT